MKSSPWLLPSLLLVPAVALSVLAAGDGVLPGDVGAARAIQRLVLPEGRRLAEAINWIGQAWPGAVVLTLVAAAILAVRRCATEAVVVAATLPLRLLNPLLKYLVDSPRPTADLVQILERADGSGFPSGHASSAILFYGALFAVAPKLSASAWLRRSVRAVAIAMILAASVARVAVGAHWPTDVLGGYLWGGFVLALLLTAYRLARRRAAATRAGRSLPAATPSHQP